ncbi:stage III sporulation protein AH [Thermanaeromonas toyohensis ToBE]|uniref:Stage III sporulation protein AH n=1 Tax=Thermanaeromonas toyohensis ToBE TaxID=698762 RepID=A0A1W1W0E0_9FIRM|nr:SpoIIIAH-like family protein [Thermanaeromonas toyohensis]SMB98584.1 stage III sporulation protein AH [Thermanaeromonas toyohensis ToBE]
MIKINDKMRVLLALVLTFGVLAYLIQGDRQDIKSSTGDTPAEGPARQVSKITAPTSQGSKTDIKAEDILKSAADKAGQGGTAFFVEYRLERDRRRSQQIDMLKQIIDNPNATSDSKQEAQKRLMDLTRQMDLELQLEKLIVAKGYKEAAVFIQPQAVNVVVMAEKITEEDANKIGDLVSRSTGRPREQISIIPQK